MKESFKPETKHVKLDDVKAAAERLMLLNDSITTLEVKRYLRAQGFIAYQSDISEMMSILSDHYGWPYNSNGEHRNYSFHHFLEYQLCGVIPKFSLS